MQDFDVPMVVRDVAEDGFVWANRLFTEHLGWTAEELGEQALIDWIDARDREIAQSVLEQGTGRFQSRHVAQNLGSVLMDWTLRREERGVVALGLLAGSQAAEPAIGKRTARTSQTLSQTLEAMALIVENQNPGKYCSILLLDCARERVSVGAGPSLPPDYNAAVEGLAIGPNVGSCGTASYWGERVVVEDIQQDVLWSDLREHAARAGVAACWSNPILARSGEVLGAIALYTPHPAAPTARELGGLELAAKMVALAVERGRVEESLRKSEAEAKHRSRLLGAVTEVMTSFVEKADWRTATGRFVDEAIELTEGDSAVLAVVQEGRLGYLSSVGPEGSTFRRAVGRGKARFRDFEPFLGELGRSVRASTLEVPGGDLDSPENGRKLGSVIGSPIRIDGETVAVLAIARVRAPFQERDLQAVSALCRAASELFDAYHRQSRQVALEDSLRRAAKMEAIGVLAGGVAHDFNNMLAVVQGNAELARYRVGQDEKVEPLLSAILTAAERSKDLCNQMLAYAGRGRRKIESVEIGALVREFGGLQKSTLSKKARLVHDLEDTPTTVQADRAQLSQVVMNLITNAAEALGDSEGLITLSTRIVACTGHEMEAGEQCLELPAGDFVRISVSDTGPGIAPELMERIYDPFFTTKRTGRGLGLAAVQGIVRSHRGAIRVESEPGQGTTFSVFLPLVENGMGAETPDRQLAGFSGNQRVLVADDEVEVLAIETEILRQAGYRVMGASDGQEAVALFERESDSIDCIVIDLSMPRLNGTETLAALRAVRQDVPVVLTSGLSEQEMLGQAGEDAFDAVLQKPFRAATFLETIQSVIGPSAKP